MLAVAVFALPFTAGALGFTLYAWRPAQRVLAWAALAASVGASFALVAATRGGMVVTVDVGGWPGGLAIVLAVDLLSAVLLSATSLVALLGVVFAAASGEDAHPLFHPLVMTMWSGVALALVTADLFNLFVAF
jgi:multicomponent Na+:H+ antiporter subunit D